MEYNFSIRGQIGSWLGVTSASVVNFLSNNKDKDIDVAICSPGGRVDAGLEIYQAFKDHGKVHAHIVGVSASAATFLAMGAKTVDMVKNSFILIHNCSQVVDYWTSANKEKLDEIIKALQHDRDDLKTVDDIITNIYVERSGNTAEVISKKMKEAKYITADEALKLGLIDSIRDDKEDEQRTADILNQLSNSAIMNYGLPALPGTESPASNDTITDGHGNPTEGFMNKILNAVKEFIHPTTNNTVTKMKKVFKNVCALLATDALESTEDVVTVKVADMQTIEDRLTALESDLNAANTAKGTLQTDLDTANGKITDLEEQIKNLKGAPGAKTDEPEDEGAVDHLENGRKLFNFFKNI